jgi:hypothetical protein
MIISAIRVIRATPWANFQISRMREDIFLYEFGYFDAEPDIAFTANEMYSVVDYHKHFPLVDAH